MKNKRDIRSDSVELLKQCQWPSNSKNVTVTGGKVAGHNFSKNDIPQGHNINKWELNWTRWQARLDLDPQSASEMTHPRCPDSSKAVLKDQGVGAGPNPGHPRPFPKIVGIILPLISMCNSPAYKNNSVCGVCFSLNLNKFTSYLSLCLSLNSFCDETSRTWVSLGPENKYHGFWLDLSSSHVGSNPKLGFGWLQVPGHGFKSQSVVNGFITGQHNQELGSKTTV